MTITTFPDRLSGGNTLTWSNHNANIIDSIKTYNGLIVKTRTVKLTEEQAQALIDRYNGLEERFKGRFIITGGKTYTLEEVLENYVGFESEITYEQK